MGYCSLCDQEKEAAAFTVKRESGVFYPYCKSCYTAKYNQTEARRKKSGKGRHPECPACSYHRRLDNNGVCWRCNESIGLKQCSSCEEILPEALSFTKDRRECRPCRNKKRRAISDSPSKGSCRYPTV